MSIRNDKRKLTHEQRYRVQFAIDNNRLEGFETDEYLKSVLEKVAVGELTKQQAKDILISRLNDKYVQEE